MILWIVPSDFPSACINPTQEYQRISRRICARCLKMQASRTQSRQAVIARCRLMLIFDQGIDK